MRTTQSSKLSWRNGFFAASLLWLCSGCFTAAVWERPMGEESPNSQNDSQASSLTDLTVVKMMATPFALVLDLCTLPAQGEYFRDEGVRDRFRRDW